MAGNNPFIGGKGLFTAWDPWAALRAQPPPNWVAVLPDKVTPEFAAELAKRGIALVIWEPEASQAGVDAVNKYGAAGYIAQAEGPQQLEAALAVGSQISVPKALVTNNFMDAWPPGWIAMPEAYQNNNPNATPDQVTRDSQNKGATEVIPVIGVGFVDEGGQQQMSSDEYAPGLNLAAQAGAVGSAAYIAEQMSDDDLNSYTAGKVAAPPPQKAPQAPQPPPPSQPAPTSTPSAQPPTPQTPPPVPPGQVPPPVGPPQGGIRPGHQAPLVEDVPDPEYATAGWGVPPVKPPDPFRPTPPGGGRREPPSWAQAAQRFVDMPRQPPPPPPPRVQAAPLDPLAPFPYAPQPLLDWLRNFNR